MIGGNRMLKNISGENVACKACCTQQVLTHFLQYNIGKHSNLLCAARIIDFSVRINTWIHESFRPLKKVCKFLNIVLKNMRVYVSYFSIADWLFLSAVIRFLHLSLYRHVILQPNCSGIWPFWCRQQFHCWWPVAKNPAVHCSPRRSRSPDEHQLSMTARMSYSRNATPRLSTSLQRNNLLKVKHTVNSLYKNPVHRKWIICFWATFDQKGHIPNTSMSPDSWMKRKRRCLNSQTVNTLTTMSRVNNNNVILSSRCKTNALRSAACNIHLRECQCWHEIILRLLDTSWNIHKPRGRFHQIPKTRFQE